MSILGHFHWLHLEISSSRVYYLISVIDGNTVRNYYNVTDGLPLIKQMIWNGNI